MSDHPRPTYQDGTPVHLGDVIRMGDSPGRVRAIISTDEYGPDFLKENWDYLETGAMLEFEAYGLIHYPENPEEDVEFVARGTLD